MSEQRPAARPAGPVAIVIVDDHAMFRRGVRAELETAGRGLVRVLAEAADVDEAVAAVATHRPDVVLLDVHLPGGGGVEVMRRSAVTGASPDTRYLALSVSDAAEDVIGTIRGGTKHNQVPDRCTISLDLRLLPSQDPYEVRRQVIAMIDKLSADDPRIKATVEFSPHWLSGPRLPYEIGTDAPIARTVADAVRTAGGEPAFRGIQFWTDMVPLKQAGIDAVNIGPGTPPYSWANEWVETSKYLEIVEIYAAAADAWCA